jgi:hypothetical protein
MENLQVARYKPGQEFHLYTDHQNSYNELSIKGDWPHFLFTSQNQIATWFPGLNDDNDSTLQGDGFDTDNDIYIPPTKGSTVFFWNTVKKPGCSNYDSEMFLNVDMRLRHDGLAVKQGEKWIANRWIHPIDMGVGVKGLSCNKDAKFASI